MFVEILTDKMISSGKELTILLDKAQVKVKASLWIYEMDLNIWRLIIASPEVRVFGPKKLYKRIQSIISKMPEDNKLVLKDIAVVDDIHPLVILLRKAVKTGRTISEIRFSRNAINGVFIEDAYIYRIT